jgi:hypothetical protein
MINDLNIELIPVSFSPEIINSHINNLIDMPLLKNIIDKSGYKIIEVITDNSMNNNEIIKTVLYDYTNNRTINITSNVETNSILDIAFTSQQPNPPNEEFEEAISILKEKDEEIKNLLETGELITYRPMPPIMKDKLFDGSIERTINIGLLPYENKNLSNESISVNMIIRSTIQQKFF